MYNVLFITICRITDFHKHSSNQLILTNIESSHIILFLKLYLVFSNTYHMIFITTFSIIKYCVLSMFRVYLHNKASRLAWDWFILLDTFPVKLHYTSFYSPSGLHYKTIFLYVNSFSVPRYLSCFGYEGNAFSAVFLLDLFAFLWDGEPSFYCIFLQSSMLYFFTNWFL